MGVTLAQGRIYGDPNSIGIAQHVIIPEANNLVAFLIQSGSAQSIDFSRVLAPVDLDDQLCLVARKISDEMSDWDLSPEMMFREALPKDAPHRPLRVGHITTEAAGAFYGASGRMMLH